VCPLALVAGQGQGTPPPAPAAAAAAAKEIPHLRKQGTATQLIVDGQPYLALAGELSNSSATGVEYMKLVWQRLALQKGLNTVLAGVSWNQIEPQEGKFDFTVLDSVIQGARAHNLRLVLLWFGTWKNGLSSYMPGWVKKDFERFPRAQIVGDQTPWPVWGVSRSQFTGPMNIELLSPFGEATRDADARAFAALMRHIKAVDGQRRTVLMIQVENEIGIQGDTRDRTPAADKAFQGPAPKELMDYIQAHKDTLIPEFRKVWEAAGFKTSGTWEEVFGKGRATEEIFMAWSFARYVDRVASAGKAEYPIPMYLNCPQNGFGRMPAPLKGSGQSGGPMPDAMDVWRAGAPKIDLFGADIYSPDFVGFTRKYTQSGNPLFIPEIRGDMEARVLYAFGRHDAIGISLMGIERLPAPETEMIRGFEAIRQLGPLIAKYQGKGAMSAVIVGQKDPPQKVQVGNYTFEVSFATPRGLPGTPALQPPFSSGVALFIAVGPDEYYAAGNSASVRIAPNTPGPEHAGMDTVEEGVFVNGRWVVSRQIAGDETGQGQDLSLRSDPPDRIPDGYAGIQHLTLYRYR
jgi:hypothetical protein